jgi:hypothetical protein
LFLLQIVDIAKYRGKITGQACAIAAAQRCDYFFMDSFDTLKPNADERLYRLKPYQISDAAKDLRRQRV